MRSDDRREYARDPAGAGAAGTQLAGLGELERIIEADYGSIAGLAIARDGEIVHERYFHGFGPGDRHHVSSVTKSVISALVGIAVDEGIIESVDRRVLDFFPDFAPREAGELAGEATLRHLLAMTAPYAFEDWHEPFAELCRQADWELYILRSLGRGGPLGRFKYSSMGAHLLSCILARATGTSARAFANERLFAPLGIEEVPDYPMAAYGYDELFGKGVRGWVEDPAGVSAGGWGLALSPREMARFGELYLGRGAWKGRRILSESWIDESLAPSSFAELAGARHPYGYLWWLGGDDEPRAFMARGDGGNIVCCLPERRAVVAIASAFAPDARDSWALIKERILPAL
jgi:CubicO group peptidase (beta-lactamase class C family)